MDSIETNQEFITPESDAEPVEKKGRSGFGRFVIDVLETIILSALLFLAIDSISARIRVDGYSMEPSLRDGEFVLVNKLAYKFGTPQLGDVIVFHFPRDPEQEYIKRIVGLPGDSINIMQGVVYVNGVALVEPYIENRPDYQSQWQVPEGHLFVLGDNRNNSSDSHRWGPVPLDYVVGKALFVYWPPKKWGMINHPVISIAEASSGAYP
ncbi:MAG TPA: signal peptidase I [Anaerolineales bacterium]|nr:signal peptidase I [Anaerolineales bacterium]